MQASIDTSQIDTYLSGMSPVKAELKILNEQRRRLKENQLPRYKPYPKQKVFHAAGSIKREVMLRAGNQLGKSLAASAEVAMHLTGIYPDWWSGRRWDRPTNWWAAGVTSESTRDNPQRLLLGRPGAHGTGWIPKSAIYGVTTARSVADAIDTIKVRHITGGVSSLSFKTYEKGREKWQGETLDGIWCDEEPPADIYFEGLTRLNATGGLMLITFTPLLGMSTVVKRFLQEKSPDRMQVCMTIHDAAHYSKAERERIIASYPAHEREARTMGVPILGSGRIFPVAEELVKVPAPNIPAHWSRIVGIDFGWDHPTAAVWIAWDRDLDVMYVYDAYRVREAGVVAHSAAIRARGSWIPVAWPHDGLQHDKGSGEQLAEQYRDQGVNMLHERAQYEETGTEGETRQGRASVEAGVAEMLQRMQTRRLLVAEHLEDWWEEFRLYHRKDGKIVKEGDDLISATRYGMMMLRYAKTNTTINAPNPHRRVRGLVS